MPRLSKAQQSALAAIRAAGVFYPYNGVSTPTVAALERHGLVSVVWKPSVRHYGPLGQSNGERGYLVKNWVAYPVEESV